MVETAGTIRAIGRDDNGDAYIRLATEDEFVSVEFGAAKGIAPQALMLFCA